VDFDGDDSGGPSFGDEEIDDTLALVGCEGWLTEG
jgi:hypothetical protein